MQFNVNEAIPAAWDFLWKSNLKERKNAFRASRTYYLTASDVEDQVRAFADDQMQGKKWGASGRAYGRPMTMTRIRGVNLNGAVRRWLLNNTSLESHNFGRGHISGMRFRPRGEPLAPQEQTTMERHTKRASRPRPVHLRKGGGPACVKRSGFGRPSRAFCTSDVSRVTCPRCIGAQS